MAIQLWRYVLIRLCSVLTPKRASSFWMMLYSSARPEESAGVIHGSITSHPPRFTPLSCRGCPSPPMMFVPLVCRIAGRKASSTDEGSWLVKAE